MHAAPTLEVIHRVRAPDHARQPPVHEDEQHLVHPRAMARAHRFEEPHHILFQQQRHAKLALGRAGLGDLVPFQRNAVGRLDGVVQVMFQAAQRIGHVMVIGTLRAGQF